MNCPLCTIKLTGPRRRKKLSTAKREELARHLVVDHNLNNCLCGHGNDSSAPILTLCAHFYKLVKAREDVRTHLEFHALSRKGLR